MSDLDALLAAIRANPDDDTPRLVYADALQDAAGSVPCPGCGGEGDVTLRSAEATWIRSFKYKELCPQCHGARVVPDGRADLAEFIRLQCRDIPRLEAVLAKPYEDQDLCSDLSANWCPVCGDCCCPSPEDGRDYPDCPLHSEDSRHHSDDSLRAKLARSRARESALLAARGREWCPDSGTTKLSSPAASHSPACPWACWWSGLT